MAVTGAPVHVGAGLRPFNPYRDLSGVTALLADAFGSELSLESRRTARLVRWMQRYPSIGWVWLGFDAWFDGSVRGFVWLDGGRVVGNANIAPAGSSRRWILSNVAVEESHRGRGIGRALVEACLREAWTAGAERVLLQVWESNEAALHLYRSSDFAELGRVTRWILTANKAGGRLTESGGATLSWGGIGRGDMPVLAELASAMVPAPARTVRPSPLLPFRGSRWEGLRALFHFGARQPTTRRRGLRRGKSLVAALALVPVSDELARVTVVAAPGPGDEAVEAMLSELDRLSALFSLGLLADVPVSLDRLQAGMAQRGWERRDSLLQLACDRPAAVG